MEIEMARWVVVKGHDSGRDRTKERDIKMSIIKKLYGIKSL
jgi:hypothetical protein